MENGWRILTGEKFSEMVNEVSRHFRLPFVIRGCVGGPLQGRVVETAGEAGPEHLRESACAAVRDHPILYNGEKIAVISAATTERKMEAVAFCIENSLRLEAETLDLSAEVVRIYEEQAIIYSLSRTLGSELEVESICRDILDEAEKYLAVKNIAIMLYEEATNELCTRQCKGSDSDAALLFCADAASGLLGGIFANGEAVTMSDMGDEARNAFPYPVRSIICVPLVTDDKGIGMLVASDKLSGEEFWSHELKLMGVFALEAAAAIRKAQLYEEINALFMHTVKALASAVDAKDPYTYGHSNRVARFTAAICEELGMGKKEARQAELAATLHDIGKIGTPENILQKPGRLDSLEMMKMREHPAKGAQILAHISELRDVITWIRHHHEWYDGGGYPDRLSGDAIPLQSRIIAVADTFDAMTSDRPYRKGMSETVALRIMEESSGSQFDPRIIEIFKALSQAGKIAPHMKRRENSGN